MHGLGSSTTFYETALSLSKLSSQYCLVRYDFDGHGLSPLSSKTEGAISIDSLAEDLKEVMDVVGVKKAKGVVGHSMSGLVALTFAAKYPDRTEKLFLIGPMKAMAPAGQEVMLKRASTVLSSGLSSIVSAVASSATSAHTKTHSPLSLALIRALVLGTSIEGYAAACKALAGASNPDFKAIEAEVLVVGGAEDYLSSPELIGGLVGELRKARKVQLEGVGHWHAVERPAEVAAELDGFFL
ncbi:putative hydrolase [Leucosporidium creatinivorum]|uniref:Putative hydrolase n=1 Tax=Leucosporidium creatinivorum TaxID=106004 RepID=A0A1Y2ER31_9BASI|nr:putative hydrolase [Leucosporidium creatinivorum]